MAPARSKTSPANRSSRGGDSVAADAGSSTPERRRMRNRMSQRAFRARQTLRIQELEKRLDEQALPDESTLVVQLQDDNARLREQLLGIHKKAQSLQISLRGLAEEAARALGLDQLTFQIIPNVDRAGNEQNGSPEDQTLPLEASSPSDTTVELDGASCVRANTLPGGSDCIFSDVLLRERTTFGSEDASVQWSNQSTSAPVLDSFIDTLAGPDDPSFQMTAVDPPALHVRAPHYPLESLSGPSIGFDRYKDLLDRAAVISNAPQILRRTNSTFSDHIDAFESSLASQWPQRGLIRAADQQLLGAIEFMITAFISVSWKPMVAWETYTKSLSALKDLTAWRMKRTLDNWQNVAPQYRPTRLQMSVEHPSVIDWIPWPSLRDKLIIHHAANPRIDDIISDVGRSYVVQADLSHLIDCPQPVIGYVSIWGLVQAITSNGNEEPSNARSKALPTGCNRDTHCISTARTTNETALSSSPQQQQRTRLPAASASELFQSPVLATAAHRELRLDHGMAFNYRLDPAFFVAYPELYDCEANVIAQGVPLKPDRRLVDDTFPCPGALDSAALAQYQDFSKLALGYVTV